MAWRRVGALSKLILTVRGEDVEFENWTGCNFPVAAEETSIFASATSGGMYSESAVQSYNPSLYAEMSGYANGAIDLDLYASVLNDGEVMYLWRPETGRGTCIRFIKDASNRKFDARMEISGQYIGYNNVYYNDQSLWPYQPNHHSGFTFILNDEGGANLVGGYWFQDQYNAQNLRYGMNFQWKTVSGDQYTQACIMSLILGQEVAPPTPGGDDPYAPGGTSTSGGGENATFDLSSDNIDVPSLPTISASGAGLLTLYQVSLQNMNDFASYLWSPLFDVDTLKKLFNDPMDAIISLGMLPFTPTGGTVSNIFIGESDTGVSATRLGSQYYELDMGSLTLDTFYDSALDLNPYTKVDLYLPYCGTVSINPDEFDGKSIHVVYHVDILTGACVVFVEDGSRVLVQSQGNILTAIPFTSKDFKSIFGAVLGDAAAAGAALFALPTGGISAAAAVGIVGGAAMNSVNSKLNMPHGGQCASTAGFLSIQKPYLIITRPAQCLPEDNAAYQGYPAYITETVGNLTGFIKISEAHFDGFTCTDGELQEIDRLLKEGVYVQ